jgi:hypothetical protein
MLFGLGVLMQQPAVFFALFGAIYLVSNNLHRRFRPEKIFLGTLIFSAGVILPLGFTCLLLWRMGVFDRFWFWTIDYAWRYGSLVPFSQAPRFFFHSAKEVIVAGWPIWTLAGIGIVTGLREQRTRPSSFSADLPILLCIGDMPGILLSIALFHFGALSRFAARRRCHQQIIGPQCRSINRSPIYPHLNSGTCHCLADARRKKVLF